jgi:hypothetical protein
MSKTYYRRPVLDRLGYWLDFKYHWMCFSHRCELRTLLRGRLKEWVLNFVFHKELQFARSKINAQWGDLHSQVKEMTSGDLNLWSGITILENGIKNSDQFNEYLKTQKDMLEFTKELLAEIREEEEQNK